VSLNENRLFQENEKCSKLSVNHPFTSAAHQTLAHKKFRQGNGPKQRWIYVFDKYQDISKIFWTGAAIYTAVVVARSTGRW
jgi:hypothetical protein